MDIELLCEMNLGLFSFVVFVKTLLLLSFEECRTNVRKIYTNQVEPSLSVYFCSSVNQTFSIDLPLNTPVDTYD